MVNSCCAFSGTARDTKESREAKIKFYRIPAKEPKRTLLINTVNRKNFNPKSHTVICSQHFVGGQKSDDPLSPAYVPSIFAFTPSPKKRKSEQGLEKYEAVKRRREEKDRIEGTKKVTLAGQTGDVEYPPNTVSVASQTDLTVVNLMSLENDLQSRTEELAKLRAAKGYPTQDDLKNSEKILCFYTGFNSFAVLMSVFRLISVAIPDGGAAKLSKFEYFTLTLMKLQLSANNLDLGFRFGISESTVGRVFSRWIEAMDVRLSFLISWPDKESLQKAMPFCFQPNYGLKVTSVIDCFELYIEKPSNPLAESCTWSQYKHCNTVKYLISITLQGVISFISNGWGGRVSDKHIVENCGYLDKLLIGDVLADRGFDIADSVVYHGALDVVVKVCCAINNVLEGVVPFI